MIITYIVADANIKNSPSRRLNYLNLAAFKGLLNTNEYRRFYSENSFILCPLILEHYLYLIIEEKALSGILLLRGLFSN